MEWFLKVLRQYADFDGRARRKEFWMFFLFYILSFIAIGIFMIVLSAISEGVGAAIGGFLLIAFFFGTLIPYLAVIVRRLHDTGKSGWMILVRLIPFVGSIWLLVLLVTDSTPGPNEYGPNPKDGMDYRIDEFGDGVVEEEVFEDEFSDEFSDGSSDGYA